MNRIEKVQRKLKEWEVDLLVVDNPVDLFYLTGQELSAGRLFIFETEAALYVDGRYFETCKQVASIPVFLQEKQSAFPTFEEKRMGFDATFTTYEAFEKLASLKGERVALTSPVLGIRMVKEAEEVSYLRKAAALGSQGYDYVRTLLKEGITEEEVAVELELFWRRAGGERVAFSPHIAFGAHSAYPHYHAGPYPLKRQENVLIDIGVVLDHYHSDMSRVVFFGDPDPQLAAIYEVVKKAQEAALERCKPGTRVAEVDGAARRLIEAEGYGAQFLHSTGHGVGLEIHELPWVRKQGEGVLEPGMVLTVEPGIYVPELGGIRLEDTVVITPEGYDNLTNRPTHLEIL
ncbi:MAG: putative peptidase [Chlamydiales bacterium]|nr:putative peptidase [Chlamydiales bacterium]